MQFNKKEKRDLYTKYFDLYYHIVFNAVYVKVENIEDTEDICQEVFIALYNNIDKVNEPKKWLFGTLKNKVMHYYRNKKAPEADIDSIFADISLTFVNGFRESRLIIEDTLNTILLKEDDRNFFNLIAVNNFSYSETAKLLGLTKRKVEYRYKQLVKKIITELKKKGIKELEDLL